MHPDRLSLAEIVDGYQSTALLYAAIKLGLPDKLSAGNWHADQLAMEIGCSASYLHRLLRALAAIGVCKESQCNTFELTEAGQQLAVSSSSGLRERTMLAVEQYWPVWANLDYSVRAGRSAYNYTFGAEPWEYRHKNPGLSGIFNSWLVKETMSAAASVVEQIDFSGVKRVADIGGGGGGLLALILNAYPYLEGILFDQPHVVAETENKFRNSGALRMPEFMAGDFFKEIPVEADLYFMKSVIHDWGDDDARRILGNCRAAMHDGAQLMLVERILPQMADQDRATIMIDMQMMLVTGGRERRLEEFESLLQCEGFAVSGVVRATEEFSIIKALPA